MKLSDFDYHLPKELIAQAPVIPRDHSRLLVMQSRHGATPQYCGTDYGNKTGKYKIEDRHFYDLVDYLSAGDVLVLNNTKVFPARLIGKKKDSGGKVEILLLRQTETPLVKGERKEVWECLLGGGGHKDNLEIIFSGGLLAKVVKNNKDGTWAVSFNKTGQAFMKLVNRIGLMPLPPYIKRNSNVKTQNSKPINDKINYQTVFADKKKVGSVAAPTAGLHFTPALLRKLKAKDVEIVYVTLHVGIGTFAPVKVENIKEHKMHPEWAEAEADVIKRVLQAKNEKRRIIAVGTTSARTLESVFSDLEIGNCHRPPGGVPQRREKLEIRNVKNNKTKTIKPSIKNYQNWTNIYIYPGYKFKIVNGLVTNFHLPKSTLLMFVSALAGKDNIDRAYQHALEKKYRFYSYGDAMLII